jgi:hypothetical protein
VVKDNLQSSNDEQLSSYSRLGGEPTVTETAIKSFVVKLEAKMSQILPRNSEQYDGLELLDQRKPRSIFPRQSG